MERAAADLGRVCEGDMMLLAGLVLISTGRGYWRRSSPAPRAHMWRRWLKPQAHRPAASTFLCLGAAGLLGHLLYALQQPLW
jgi:hypothetical protein